MVWVWIYAGESLCEDIFARSIRKELRSLQARRFVLTGLLEFFCITRVGPSWEIRVVE